MSILCRKIVINDENTVDRVSFAGLNFHGFDPMKYFVVHWPGVLVLYR